MKIIDRYILGSFLRDYAISLGVLIGLYIMLDMVVNIDELTTQQSSGAGIVATIVGILDYYAHQAFLIFTQLSGVIPVVAAAFTLARLGRNNEQTAVLAAGVPLVRLAAPIMLTAAALNLILLPINQELIVPSIVSKLNRERSRLSEEHVRSFPVKLLDEQGRMLSAARFIPAHVGKPPTMEGLDIIETDGDFRPQSLISADRAAWSEERGEWLLENGRRTTGLAPGQQRSLPQPVEVYRSNLTPREILLVRSGKLIELLSTAEINRLLERPQVYGTADLLRVKHARLAQLIMNVILVLLAIGSILTREPGQLRERVLLCFALVGVAMATIFVCQHLAGRPPAGSQYADAWPAIFAWVPIFLFFPLAVVMVDRVKS
jgi:lipopolysaccharide export LptBFGC system permease protein LptF